MQSGKTTQKTKEHLVPPIAGIAPPDASASIAHRHTRRDVTVRLCSGSRRQAVAVAVALAFSLPAGSALETAVATAPRTASSIPQALAAAGRRAGHGVALAAGRVARPPGSAVRLRAGCMRAVVASGDRRIGRRWDARVDAWLRVACCCGRDGCGGVHVRDLRGEEGTVCWAEAGGQLS